MKITSYFSILPPFADKASRVKDWVCNATDVFIQFCTERVWRYLEQDQILQPHLQKINTLCIAEKTLPFWKLK